MKSWFVDTETCGLHGVPVLLQYAVDDGPVNIHHLWKREIAETLELIHEIVYGRVIAHNLRFDWFMLSKWYNMLRLLPVHKKPIDIPVGLMAEVEYEARNGMCLKPQAAVDTLLLANKSEDQSFLMDTKAIYVRRIPVGVAEPLCHVLNEQTDLPWILFAGKKPENQHKRWEVVENTDRQTGEVDPYWNDIKITFAPSKGLKDLCKFLTGHEPSAKFDEIALEEYPAEEGFAPFAKLLSSEEEEWLYPIRKKKPDGSYSTRLVPTWPGMIGKHIDHWANDEAALAYAEDDIVMLKKLWDHFGSVEEDMDSLLACQVSSVRLAGFSVNVDGMIDQREISQKVIDGAEINVNSPKQVAGYIAEALDEMEQVILKDGSNKKVIDNIKKEFCLEEEEECFCEDTANCARCGGTGKVGPGKMPVVLRVEHIEEVRKHTKRVQLYDKLILAKRAYPDFNVIGTKSGRMSGASGLNFHGIDHSGLVRALFTLADEGEILSAGDYSSQELAIAATTMADDELMKDMESGKSLHGLFGAAAYETSYEEIMKKEDDRYGKAKGGVYAILYGGTFETVAKNMGIDVSVAEAAYNRMVAKYPQMGVTRKKITERFSSMHQTSEGKIVYRDPPEKFIESVFGFRRYFETEYAVQRMILASIKAMPKEWKDLDIKVERKPGKLQSISGAVCSALYGASFSIQNKVIRASNNHVIQSTGRHLTVGMQAAVWELQPHGIHPFVLRLMSIHDELAVCCQPETVPLVSEKIEAKIDEQCDVVPLISIEWFTDNPSWAEKGDGDNGVVFGWKPGE